MSGSISTYLDALKTKLTEVFAERVDTIDYLLVVDSNKKLDTPAILLEVESIDEGIDAGDEKTPLSLKVSAFCILSKETTHDACHAEVEIINFAAEVIATIRNQRWGLTGIGKPTAITSQPALFNPGKEGDEVWQVSWEQSMDVGTSIWAPSGTTPSTVFLGRSPDVGTGHEDDYEQIFPPP